MPPATPAPSRIVFAKAPGGYELPVIDVTHPAFALAESPEALAAMRAEFLDDERRQRRIPTPLMRLFMTLAARRSLMLRALVRPDTPFLSGLSTYVMKLGSDNLVPPFDSRLDHRIAASAAVRSLRLRLQQTARLLADGLLPELRARPGAPLHLLNIGGGPAIDSLNALILLRRMSAEVLERPVTVLVLDPDTDGPLFGANALAALRADGAPLAGLKIVFRHETYDWNDMTRLTRLLRSLTPDQTVVAASSEGALFEYPGDAVVTANLEALNFGGHGVRLVAGSVTRGDDITRRMLTNSPFRLVPRGVEAFARLAAPAGFSVVRIEPAMLSDQVLLVPDRH